jgi:hypothetical protein
MAKGQKRSGREPKKPKQNKPKPTSTENTFAGLHDKPAAPARKK